MGVLVGNLGVLAWFKYAGFPAVSADGLLRLKILEVDLPYPEVVLPVGIPFFTFQRRRRGRTERLQAPVPQIAQPPVRTVEAKQRAGVLEQRLPRPPPGAEHDPEWWC